MGRRRAVGVAVGALAGALLAAACTPPQDPGAPPASGEAELTLGVFGDAVDVAAFEDVVEAYNGRVETAEVTLRSWPDRATMVAELADVAPADLPDVYLMARRDLRAVVEQERNEPLFDLLEARDLNYGDAYSQKAIEAFSADDDLQCMPYSLSPMVIYYNTDLIDFDRMRARGLATPDPEPPVVPTDGSEPEPTEEPTDGTEPLGTGVDAAAGWSFEEFVAAARFASRGPGPRRGVAIAPSLPALAPFLSSGGSGLFGGADDPTSLAFAEGANLAALSTVLEVLRDPALTLSDAQLDQATPLEWFERGRVGMIEGFRDLTPRLREVPGLEFDVMPMPRLGADATIGDALGLCLAPGPHLQAAADFLLYAVSEDGVRPVTEAGHVVPAALGAARTDAFLQPGLAPAHPSVFNAAAEDIVLLPLLDRADELETAVAPLLHELLLAPVVDDLPALATEIDEASRAVLDPDYEEPTGEPGSEGSSEP